MKYYADLILGKASCIFIFFHFLDSRPSVLNGLHFYFSLRDGANRELTKIVNIKYNVDVLSPNFLSPLQQHGGGNGGLRYCGIKSFFSSRISVIWILKCVLRSRIAVSFTPAVCLMRFFILLVNGIR